MELIDREFERKLNNLTLTVYILQAASLFVGVTAIVGIVINYLKRDDTRGTLYESHFLWQMRTFWWGLLGLALGYLTVFLLVGFLILFAVYVWLIYRVVKGFLNLNDGKPMPL
ncbi:membrane protein [Pseudogulbenkiania sp. MAI-1]|uniref:DUF4870 family protein n=1 Tax=Pseudogulbenkiania sp. MAI-1 TaxID=990370 RepID=UPI00045EBA0C|nr:membrane protein [Pseudogulbenkiania sp. MAI-1]